MLLSEAQVEEKRFQISRAFKPATPINRTDLFAGRKKQIHDILDAIAEDGRHIVVFGERGVGKTSLANVLAKNISSQARPVLAPMTSCTNQDSFGSIWRRIFEELHRIGEERPNSIPETGQSLLDDLAQRAPIEIEPDAVRRLLTVVGKEAELFAIIDEFDTVTSEAARQTMADCMKYLSDRTAPATVILIGVSDDIDGLIRHHQSTERFMAQIQMPRMRHDEITALLTKCLSVPGMTIEKDALNGICCLAKGLPHYAHLLGKYAGLAALGESQSDTIMRKHLRSGIAAALEQAQQSVQSLYRQAISSSRQDAQYKRVLLACAMAETDEFGYFPPVSVRDPLSKLIGVSAKIEAYVRHLHAFSLEERGPVLMREIRGKRRPKFRFVNPLVQPYILLRAVNEGNLDEQDLYEAAGIRRDDEPGPGKLF